MRTVKLNWYAARDKGTAGNVSFIYSGKPRMLEYCYICGSDKDDSASLPALTRYLQPGECIPVTITITERKVTK